MQLFSAAYLPTLPWFYHWLTANDCCIDVHEHFVKQSFRNRTLILSANGVLPLVIPVKKSEHHTPMVFMRMENDFKWQHQHWQAIQSAYQSAPYFEHYGPQLQTFYETPYTNLVDWNLDLLKLCLRLMRVHKPIVTSNHYMVSEIPFQDYRVLISPKRELAPVTKPYLQVFTEKFPFAPNLSILDLLFNHGPRWNNYLQIS
ncbi:MAG: WbqC family protein [Bacteroidia bacterium]|jgi:hypothetical protein|nr:WbqC family protein [Bacteroidia bacterium]